MKLERLHEYVSITIVTTMGIGLALYAGSLNPGNQVQMSAGIVGGAIAVIVALMAREKIWLLIPLFWPMMGQIVGLPGSFPVRDLAILYVFPIFLALKALKVVRVKGQYNWLDYLLWLNLFWLATVYIRNPVGTLSMGMERIGGKFYFEAAIVTLAYWVIGHVTISPKLAANFRWVLISGDLFSGIFGFISYHFPSTVPILGKFYTGISTEGYNDATSTTGARVVAREGYLANTGYAVLRSLYSWYPPFSTLSPLRFWRLLFSILAVIGILRSGFRSTIFSAGCFFAIACYFRHGMTSVVRVALILTVAVGMLVAAQGTLIDLPLTAQRTLSFLPGKWNREALDDAVGSTEWRHEVWRKVWTSGHKYIDNWWFGDGFGLTRHQYLDAVRMASVGANDETESLIITGNYHSGPLTTIHIIGFVGLGTFTILLFGISYYGWQLILRARGTPYFPVAIFFGAQAIFEPLPFLILTGFFDIQLVGSIYSIAMMRMISRSLDQFKLAEAKATIAPEEAFPGTGLQQRFRQLR